jgi:hypothetical protein
LPDNLSADQGVERGPIIAKYFLTSKYQMARFTRQNGGEKNDNDYAFFKPDVYRRPAPIDLGLSPFENYWTTLYQTVSGLIKTRMIGTQSQG